MDTSIRRPASSAREAAPIYSAAAPSALVAALAVLPPQRQMDLLISQPNAAELVAALDPLPVYHLIKVVGEEDSVELIHLASAEQVQAFVDLECWQGDAFHSGRLAHWLRLLLEQRDDANLLRQLRAIDAEDLVLLLKAQVAVFVFDEDDEAPPELLELGRDWEESPDRVYKLVFSDDEDTTRLIRHLLDRLYELDIDYARLLLDAARSELSAPLEDSAFQIRNGRLEDLGFVPVEEALAIYAPAPAERLKRELLRALEQAPVARGAEAAERFFLPVSWRDALDRGFLAQARRRLLERGVAFDDEAFAFRVAALVNRALIADFGAPGDVEGARVAAERSAGYMTLGLQYAADMDLDRAADLLTVAWPQQLFRLGFALTVGLRLQAEQLLANPGLAETLSLTNRPLSLLPEAHRAHISALLQPRPAWADPDGTLAEPFTDLAQIHRAGARTALIAFQVMSLFGILKLDRSQLAAWAYADDVHPAVELITTETLLNTAFARAALGLDPLPAPLTVPQLADLLAGPLDEVQRVIDDLPGEPRQVNALEPLDHTLLGRRAIALLTTSDQLDAQALPVVRTTVRRLLEGLADALGTINPEDVRDGTIAPHFLGNALLLKIG